VSKLDRLSRLGVGDALKLVERIHETGGEIAAIDLGIDPTTPFGEFGMTLMLALARMERRRLADTYAQSQSRAVDDGIHIARAPAGYVRENGKRSKLVPDPAVAPLIREAFARRARGDSWQAVADHMRAHGVSMSRSGVMSLVRNRAYVGEARGPNGLCNPGAHEAIVTMAEFDRAQGRARPHARDGSIAALGMLSGLITCAACGHRLTVLGGPDRRGPNGERLASYRCSGNSAAGKCPAPGAARVALVDEYTRKALGLALADGTLSASMDAISRYTRAAQTVEKAKADLDALADTRLLAQFGPERLALMAEAQNVILEAARQALRDTPTPDSAIKPDDELFAGLESWPIEKERAFARQFIAEVTLTRKGRGPINERVSIRWAGHDEFDATLWQRMQADEANVLDPLIAAGGRGPLAERVVIHV